MVFPHSAKRLESIRSLFVNSGTCRLSPYSEGHVIGSLGYSRLEWLGSGFQTPRTAYAAPATIDLFRSRLVLDLSSQSLAGHMFADWGDRRYLAPSGEDSGAIARLCVMPE
jgi:hypothetical protein